MHVASLSGRKTLIFQALSGAEAFTKIRLCSGLLFCTRFYGALQCIPQLIQTIGMLCCYLQKHKRVLKSCDIILLCSITKILSTL